ncbi:MAG TPA: hypothetical protein VIG80_05775 [Bacillaceae bacterium]
MYEYDEIQNMPQIGNIDEFVRSITRIENAFANILNGEAEFLNRNRDRFTAEEFFKFNERLEEILKLVIKKEIILEFLLDEIKKCPQECPKEPEEDHCSCKEYYCECDYYDYCDSEYYYCVDAGESRRKKRGICKR